MALTTDPEGYPYQPGAAPEGNEDIAQEPAGDEPTPVKTEPKKAPAKKAAPHKVDDNHGNAKAAQKAKIKD